MSFFIADAMAQAAPAGAPAGGGWEALLFPLLLVGVFYFLMIRPQQKRAKEHKTMLEGLKKGDEVVTSGGVLGRVTEVGDSFLQVEVADGVHLKVQKQAVGSLMPKGTYKNS